MSHNGAGFLVNTGSGPQFRAQLTVQRDVQLTFELDSTNASTHPFFLTTSNTGGSSAGALTAQINTVGATVTFTPTAANTSPIYYQCSVHMGMGAAINIVSPDAGSDGGADAGTDAGADGGTDAGSDGGGSDGGSEDAGSGSDGGGSGEGQDGGAGDDDRAGGSGGCSAAPVGLWLGLGVLVALVRGRGRRPVA